MKHISIFLTFLVTAAGFLAGPNYLHAGEVTSDHVVTIELPGGEESSADTPAINLHASYTYDYFHNVSGGIRTGGAGMGLLDIGFEADLERLFGWDGTSFVVTAFAGHGSDFSANYAGDFGVASNIYHGNEFNLYNIYLQKAFGEGDSYFKVGQIAADDEFMSADAAGTLINSTFGPFNTQSGNIGAPIFPFAAPGAVVHYVPTEHWYLTIGIYAGLLEIGGSDNRGFDWRWGGGSGQAVFAETGFVYDKAGSVFKLGGYYHTGEFEDFSSGETVDGLGAVYAVVNQSILDVGEQETGVSAFLRGSLVSDEDRAIATGYIDAGI
ncbi:MAG: carbohydrate porin, partial [Verrucomicrobiota bacterium]